MNAGGEKAAPTPTELRIGEKGRRVRIVFEDGRAFDLSAELLRVESPSAEVKGHGGERQPPPAGRANARIVGAAPVGRYAVRLAFDDGHDSGLFTWAYLLDLAENQAERFKAYVERLEAFGLSR